MAHVEELGVRIGIKDWGWNGCCCCCCWFLLCFRSCDTNDLDNFNENENVLNFFFFFSLFFFFQFSSCSKNTHYPPLPSHSGKQATIAIHLPASIRVTQRNERGADMDSRKGGTIINATTPRGQGILGQLYFNGQGVKKSYKLAKFWAKMSAEQGFAESQYGLGQLYLRGEGVSRSYAQAKHWFEMAAGQGHAPARRALALLYARGQGVVKSYDKAREFCEMAAELGLASAQSDLGFMYSRGLGIDKSWEMAKHWYELAAEQQHAAAYLNLGKMYFRGDCEIAGQSFDRAREYFELAANSKDVKASQGMYNLATMYQHGKGVKQSNERARALLKQAADLGHKQAIEQLAEWNRLNHISLKHSWETMFA